MKVKQAMHKGVQWVDPGTSVEKLATLLRQHDIGVPIGENDRLIGMVTDRDIVCLHCGGARPKDDDRAQCDD